MINSISYSKQWITDKAATISKRTDLKLMEKVIQAFVLLEQLSLTGLPFVFKGGTALLLLAKDNPQRYSIDIDIITETLHNDLIKLLDRIIEKGAFIRWEDDNHRKRVMSAPVGHYKFYYHSTIEEGKEEPVLLDVLFSAPPYASIQSHELKHPWLSIIEPPTVVSVPDMSSLAGDKLTAFAPNTIGILYSKNRPAEIMKQLFDLGFLFDHITNLKEVRESYIRTAKDEIGYRNLKIAWQESLQDTFNTCLTIANRDTHNEQFQYLLNGNKRLANFILHTYSIDHTVLSAAKTAYLLQMVMKNKIEKLSYNGPDQIVELAIAGIDYSKIQKLKKSNPEAFFYWYHALTLLSE